MIGQRGYIIMAVSAIALAAVISYYYYYYHRKESFGTLPSRTWKVEREFMGGCSDGSPDFFQTPHFQGILSPRFSNVDYGPYIRTQLPPYDKMAVTADPLGGDVGGSFAAAQSGCAPTGSFMDADGELKQPIVYDRYMYANRGSRLRAAGDPIRGDLPIVPASGNWFTPSVHPNVDLQAGAMNVMGGVSNDNSNRLADLIYYSSGGGDTTIGGVDLRQETPSCGMMMSNNTYGAFANGGGDVIMQSYPM